MQNPEKMVQLDETLIFILSIIKHSITALISHIKTLSIGVSVESAKNRKKKKNGGLADGN